MNRRLEGRTAVIIGGSSGIGLATARLFHSEGARLAIIGRDPTRLEQARNTLGPDIHALAADASRPHDLAAAFEAIGTRFERVDVLFANAGLAHCPPLRATTSDFFDGLFAANVKSALFGFLAAWPLLSTGASVIFTGSATHDRGRPGDALYLASKAALRSLARTLAADEGVLERRIRINIVSPGPIHTAMTAELAANPEIDAWVRAQVPMGRWGEADEVARAVLFLASSEASYTTGTDLAVDGGLAQI